MAEPRRHKILGATLAGLLSLGVFGGLHLRAARGTPATQTADVTQPPASVDVPSGRTPQPNTPRQEHKRILPRHFRGLVPHLGPQPSRRAAA